VIVPAIRGGATVMVDVFGDDEDDTDEGNENAKGTRHFSIEQRPEKLWS
jgi:hypothetical protein